MQIWTLQFVKVVSLAPGSERSPAPLYNVAAERSHALPVTKFVGPRGQGSASAHTRGFEKKFAPTPPSRHTRRKSDDCCQYVLYVMCIGLIT